MAGYRDMAQDAREACACYHCHGGYPVGGMTLSMKEKDERPMSCLAVVIFKSMDQLDGVEMAKSDAADAERKE